MHDWQLVIRRSIVLSAIEPGVFEGWVEDNFHHFGVRLTTLEGHVIDVEANTVRYPWSTCADAGTPLRAIVGQELEHRAAELVGRLPMKLQCTHLFELALLTMAHAARAEGTRRYDMAVCQDAADDTRFNLELMRDGSLALEIQALGSVITSPPMLARHELYDGFRSWLRSLPDDQAEALWIARRGFWLAAGLTGFEEAPSPDAFGLGEVCHTFQSAQRFTASPMLNSRIDVTDRNVGLCSKARSD